MGFEHCFYVNNLCSPSKFTLSELHYTVVASVMIKRRLQTMQTVQTRQAVQQNLMRFFRVYVIWQNNRGVKFLELVQISPTWQDVICMDRDTDLEVRNVLCERSK